MASAAGSGMRWMRDPTRGGVATILNELARDCGSACDLYEDAMPVRDAVRGACELLGLDPLHIANEGQFLAVVAPEVADRALDALRKRSGRRRGGIIGEITRPARGHGARQRRSTAAPASIDMLVGDPLPRIC